MILTSLIQDQVGHTEYVALYSGSLKLFNIHTCNIEKLGRPWIRNYGIDSFLMFPAPVPESEPRDVSDYV